MKRNIETIGRLERIFDDWNRKGSISAIERAMILRLLGELYERVYFTDTAPADECTVEKEPALQTVLQPIPEHETVVAHEQVREVESKSEPEIESGTETEHAIVTRTDAEPQAVIEIETGSEPAVESEATAETEPSVEAEEQDESETIIMPKHHIDRKTILSIYDDSYGVAPKPEPETKIAVDSEPIVQETVTDPKQTSDPEPIVEEPVTEAEIHSEIFTGSESETTVEPERVSEPEPVAEITDEPHVVTMGGPNDDDHRLSVAEKISSLRESIGLNDKFLLMADLFSNDNNLYDQTIDTLDRFTSLDDALLYIHDNYRWNPNSDGANLLVDLLARKLM